MSIDRDNDWDYNTASTAGNVILTEVPEAAKLLGQWWDNQDHSQMDEGERYLMDCLMEGVADANKSHYDQHGVYKI